MPNLAQVATRGLTHASLSVSALVPHERNYRSHSPAQIRRIEASLRRFGQVRSVVVQATTDDTYRIVAGHGLVQAAQRARLTTVHCDVIPADWSDADVAGYLIADNQTAALAQDDDALLSELLREQASIDPTLASVGSSQRDLDSLLATLAATLASPPTREPVAPRLAFEGSSSYGTFHLYTRSQWTDDQETAFRAWKGGDTGDTARMALELANGVRQLFGGVIPDGYVTVPPAGAHAADERYPAGELADAVGAALGLPCIVALCRQENDISVGRGRYPNLRDHSRFAIAGVLPPGLAIVIDDVVTTGNTFARCRHALREGGVPHVLLAYVVWR